MDNLVNDKRISYFACFKPQSISNMKTICTAILMLISQLVFCCSCVPNMPFKSKEDLKNYNYVALVTITELAPYDTMHKAFQLRTSGKISTDIVELFKGEPLKQFNDASYNTDCAFKLEVGERWLFLGNSKKGVVDIDVCGYSVKYSDANGLRDWLYFGGINELGVLRTIFGHTEITNAVHIQLYPNKKTEVEQSFKNGQLNGVRKIYYPDGKIYIIEKFKNGQRIGFRNYYGASGQLRKHVTYKNGLIAEAVDYQDTTEDAWYMNFQIHYHNDLLFGDRDHDTTFFIRKLDSLRSLKNWDKTVANIFKYSRDGLSYIQRNYDYKGDIRLSVAQNWEKQTNEAYHYRDNGTLEYYMLYDQKNDRQVEYDYDKNGNCRDFEGVK